METVSLNDIIQPLIHYYYTEDANGSMEPTSYVSFHREALADRGYYIVVQVITLQGSAIDIKHFYDPDYVGYPDNQSAITFHKSWNCCHQVIKCT